ncbi:MAG TPA: hypothetical protein VJV79_35540 [Polyangiaceae bacterium]|nr:hypothetical protein [Polyangiaceae bacterium]
MTRFLALAVVAFGAFATQQVSAANPDDTPISRSCRLCSRLAPELGLGVPIWVPMVIGTFGYDSTAPPVQIDSSIRFAFMGRISARAWGLELRAESFGVGFNSRFDRRDEEDQGLDASALISRGIAAYHLPVIAFGHSRRAVLLGFVPYAGARLQRVSARLPVPHTTDSQDRALSWWYGLAGTAIELDFRVGLTMRLELDVGGFKPDSNMAWWGAISSEYAFSSWLGLSAGWNFYQIEHDAEPFDLRLRLNGPELALSFYLH